jgi:hypothetical protein
MTFQAGYEISLKFPLCICSVLNKDSYQHIAGAQINRNAVF